MKTETMIGAEEVEAKFDVAPGTPLPSFEDVVPGVEVVELPAIELTARYFDTAGFRLLRQGATLRQRRGEEPEGENLWTLKLPSAKGGAAYSRKEISWPGATEDIPPQARELVHGIALGSELAEVAVLVSTRRRLEMVATEGGCLAEIDDDTVEVRSPREFSFRQVEVELRGGDGDLLAGLAERLSRVGATRGNDEPKLARALAGTLDPPPWSLPVGERHQPGRGSDATRDLTIEQPSMRDLVSGSLSDALSRLLANDAGVRLDDGPEFVHQARVATRRLRSDLKTFGRFIDADWVDETRSELRWLGTALGAVRDADVLAERLRVYAGCAGLPDEEGFAQLLIHAASGRAEAMRDLRAVMCSERYVRLLRALEGAAVAPPMRAGEPRSAAASCRLLLDANWRGVRRRVRSVDPDASALELHRIRIRAKQLRYAGEAVETVLGEPAERLAAAAEGVQTVLGEHQDAVATEAWARAAVGRVRREGVLAAGQVVALERIRQSDARRAWRKAWKRLRREAAHRAHHGR